jgi:hypothetical protein
MIKLEEPAYQPTDKELQEAIELRCSECFPAMNIANSIGGNTKSIEWRLVRSFSLVELIKEAMLRGLPVEQFKSAVGGKPIKNTTIYLAAMRAIDDESKNQMQCES